MTDTTNPAEETEFEPVETEEVVDDHQDDQVSDDQDDEDGDEPDDEVSQEDETEEVERGGVKYRIPKALKDDLLRQDDYTRKTQALAEERRAWESERAKAVENNEAIEAAKFDLRAVQSRINDLSALSESDWMQIRAMDQRDGTNRYDQLQREMLSLPRKESELKTTLDAKVKEVAQSQQEILAKRASEGHAILQRDIPGWGPELGAKLVDFVKSEYGITEEKHGDAFMDPAIIKLAHAAFKAKETERKAKVQGKAAAVAAVRPAPQVRSSATPRSGPSERMSTEEWVRQRESQLAKKARA